VSDSLALEVVAPRARLLAALQAGQNPRPRITVGQFVPVYATTKSIVPETVRQYQIVAKIFEQWAGGPVFLDELDELVVSAWLRDYGASGVAAATVRSKRNSFLALWRSAADELFCEPPTRRVRVARVPWKPPTAWTLAEVRRLLDAAHRLRRLHPCGLRRREWWPLAIRISWDTGLRWGDLISLRVDEIRGRSVVKAQSKTSRAKVGRIAASTREALAESIIRHPRDLVCPWGQSNETFRQQVRRLVAKAGIRPGTWKWIRRAGSCDVELQDPGRGHAARHLGHAPGSRVAEVNYLDPELLAEGIDVPTPRDLDGLRVQEDRS